MSDPKPTYHHGDLRSALIEAATEIITESGVDAMTMRGLATRVGVSRTAPYRHFSDKTTLLAAVALEGYQRLAHCMNRIRNQEHDGFLEQCRELDRAYMVFAIENAAHYRLMFGENAVSLEQNPEVREAARAAYKLLLEVIKQGQTEGVIVKDNPLDIAFLLWSQLHGIAQLAIDGHLPLDRAEAMASFATDTITFGLLPRD